MVNFKVVTDTGGLAADKQRNSNDPLSEQQAEADAADRNRRAEELGIKTRYLIKPA